MRHTIEFASLVRAADGGLTIRSSEYASGIAETDGTWASVELQVTI